MTRSNKLAGWHESDFGWRWKILALTIQYQNVCFIEGVIHESQSIEGIIHESQEIEGIIEEEQSIEGKIGCGDKL